MISEEGRKRMREKKMGNKYWLGKHHSTSTIEKMRHTGKNKRVVCVNSGDVYCSTREVERKTGISAANISKCCTHDRKSAGGFCWEYID